MESPTPPTLTPALPRFVALALIVLVAGALAYLRFGTGSDPVSVPAGGRAGDLTLKPCHYATEQGSYQADCGTLVVPENRADAHSRLIALPVTRIRSRSAHPGDPLFRLEGGPGLTNMQFGQAGRFADRRDVVLVGYRGVDGSSVLDCPEVQSALEHSKGFLGAASMRAYAQGFRSCATRLQHDGVDLAGYTLAQRVDDLEAARVGLGYRRIDLLSESAGTRTALIYAWRHPASIHRSVMIGVNPPGHFLWDARTTDEQIGRYAAACAHAASCHRRTDDLAATMRHTARDIPDRWWFLPIKRDNVRLASFYGLADTSSAAAPLSAPLTLGSWLSADRGDPSGFWLMSLAADVVFPRAFVWGDLAAVGRADAGAAKAYFAAGRHASILGDAGTRFMWADGRLADAWPAAPGEAAYSRVRRSNVETLLIGGELDTATPPQAATKELLPSLEHGHQVVLRGFGHTTDFWTYQPKASGRLVETFLASGAVDDSLYRPGHVDFRPAVTQSAIAKIALGSMVGLALLAVLALLGMARRVRRRGAFGRKASATLRTLAPVLLGLGGWFLGALIVLVALPGVPLDDARLAVLAVGVPVGLGVYWASVHRDRSARSTGLSLAVALGGALAGTWLGLHATANLLALLTAIVGAALGANLAVILLDLGRAWSAGRRVAATPARAPAALTARGATPR